MIPSLVWERFTVVNHGVSLSKIFGDGQTHDLIFAYFCGVASSNELYWKPFWKSAETEYPLVRAGLSTLKHYCLISIPTGRALYTFQNFHAWSVSMFGLLPIWDVHGQLSTKARDMQISLLSILRNSVTTLSILLTLKDGDWNLRFSPSFVSLEFRSRRLRRNDREVSVIAPHRHFSLRQRHEPFHWKQTCSTANYNKRYLKLTMVRCTSTCSKTVSHQARIQ